MIDSELMTRDRLKSLRKARGLSQEKLAQLLNVSVKTVCRWEDGTSMPRPYQRAPLAEALNISLADLSRILDAESELGGVHGGLTMYEQLEQQSTSIRNYEPTVIPGLLQTEDYARQLSKPDVVAIRMERQAALFREIDPLTLVVLMDEVALMRVAGTAEIMEDQLTHLVELARYGNIDIRIIPVTCRQHAVGFGAFVILGGIGNGIVYVEHRTGGTTLQSPFDVEEHIKVFDRLTTLSLPIQEYRV
jgi:transcriptional regulator with XRE-family HTH domain